MSILLRETYFYNLVITIRLSLNPYMFTGPEALVKLEEAVGYSFIYGKIIN